MNEGLLLQGDACTAEGVAANWDRIMDRSTDAPVANAMEQSQHGMDMVMKSIA